MQKRNNQNPQDHIFHRHVHENELDFSMHGMTVDVKWVANVSNDKVWAYSKHLHSALEFHIIPEGVCTLVIEEETPQTVSAGQLYIIPPGVYHSQESDPNNPAIEYGLNCAITIDSSAIPEKAEEVHYIDHIQNSTEVKVVEDRFKVYELFETLFREVQNKHVGYHTFVQLLIYQIIIRSVRAVLDESELQSGLSKPNIDQVRMERIDAFIDDNISGHITLKDISNLLYVSERHVNRIVFSQRGKPLHQYVLARKCEQAMLSLNDPHTKIYDVAEKLGFSSSHHFSRAFKKQYGLLPGEYRKSQLSK